MSRVRALAGWLAVFLVLGVALSVTVVPAALHARPLVVLTGSMEPALRPGDVAVMRDVEHHGRIVAGDIVAYHPRSGDPTLITHRVEAKLAGANGARYITRGDANGTADEPIKHDQVAGVHLYTVPKVGHALNWAQRNRPSAILIVLAAGAVSWALGKASQRDKEGRSS